MPLSTCPHCRSEMMPLKRDDIEIDFCPKCRGVWLDGGELDKLLAGARHDAQRTRKGDEQHPHFGKRQSTGLLDFFE